MSKTGPKRRYPYEVTRIVVSKHTAGKLREFKGETDYDEFIRILIAYAKFDKDRFNGFKIVETQKK